MVASKSTQARSRRRQKVSVAVDIAAFFAAESGLQLPLVRVRRQPYEGMWALPGGLIGEQEELTASARRQLEEETGVKPTWLEQLYTFSDPERDPLHRVVSVGYLALVSPPQPPLELGTGHTAAYSDIGWHPVDALPELAFDHAQVVQSAVERLRAKIEYSNLAFALLPRAFSLSQMQAVYECVLGRPLDKRNFRRRVSALELVEPTGQTQRGGAHRPAALYRFRDRELRYIRVL